MVSSKSKKREREKSILQKYRMLLFIYLLTPAGFTAGEKMVLHNFFSVQGML